MQLICPACRKQTERGLELFSVEPAGPGLLRCQGCARTYPVIDNTTPRDARGWYAVLVRYRDNKRAPHPFKLGDAATSGKTSAPFLNPNRTGELRAEVEGLLADAQDQWNRWKSEQDGGARREAKRMVGDALLIWPDYPAAKKLLAEMS